VIGKMTEVLSHIGAWAPKPEQTALAKYIKENHDDYLSHIDYVTKEYEYISVYLGYVHSFSSTEEYISFLINTCGLGIVPFEYFGSKENKGWFRISIGNISSLNLDFILDTIEKSVLKSNSFINSMIF